MHMDVAWQMTLTNQQRFSQAWAQPCYARPRFQWLFRWSGLEIMEEGDPGLAKPHLFSFSSLMVVYPFETFPCLCGRQIFCYIVTWPLDVDGREWMESMHLPWNKWCFICACLNMCMLLHFNDFFLPNQSAKCNIYNQSRMHYCKAGAWSCQMKAASFPCQKQEALGKMEIGQ